MSDQKATEKTCANNIKLEAVDFVCVYVNFTIVIKTQTTMIALQCVFF